MLIGGLQIFAVTWLGRMMIEGGPFEKIIGFSLFLLKMAAIIAVLYLISTVSLEHLLWAAGGILLGLLAVSFYMLKRRRKGILEARSVNGDDSSNG